MQISSAMAGYSLGQARPAPSRHGQEEGRSHGWGEGVLLGWCRGQDIDAKIAEGVFELMEKFAGYGFNRSHSAAYGLLTYQTAYLKYYYPVEFFAGLLTCGKDKTDEVVKFIAEARAQGISVLRLTSTNRARISRSCPRENRRGDAQTGQEEGCRSKEAAAPKNPRIHGQGHPLWLAGGQRAWVRARSNHHRGAQGRRSLCR